MTRILLTTLLAWMVMRTGLFAQNEAAGNAMVTLEGTASTWTRQCERAFALYMGVPEERLKEWVPGFDWPALPPEMAPIMSGDPAKLEELIPLFKDSRPTRINGENMLGDADKGTFLTVADLVNHLVIWLVPMGSQGEIQDETLAEAAVEKQIRAWAKKAAGLKSEDRLAAWYAAAEASQRRMVLAFFIATDHANAWPLVEDDLLKRAKTEAEPDYVILEAAAYVRHRKHEAAAFVKKLSDTLKPGVLAKEYGPFFAAKDGRFMLVEPLTPAERVQQFVEGSLTDEELSEWIIRGIDQPWAYHSMGIEPSSVHLKHVDRCLEAALVGAAKTSDLGKRLALLEICEGLSENRNDIARHSRKDELRAIPGPRDASQTAMVAALRALLTDSRERFTRRQLSNPAHHAALCVWNRWGTNTRHLDSVFHGVAADWRGRANGFPHDLTAITTEAAVSLLDATEAMQPESFPEARAQELAKDLMSTNENDWRVRLKTLNWEEKLMLCEQASRDDRLARHVWPRMQRLQNLQAATDTPETFQKLWKDKCESKLLDPDCFTALKSWVAMEAESRRHWAVVAESSAGGDGLTLHVCQALEPKKESSLKLRISLEGTEVYTLIEELKFDGKSWQPVQQPYSAHDPSISHVLGKLGSFIPTRDGKAHIRQLRLIIASSDD